MAQSIFESGGRTFKFANRGDTVEGDLVEFREEQQHEFDRATGKPSDRLATYDDGNPIMQLVLTLETDILDDDEDDGRRYVYVSSARAKKAVVQAVRAAGVKVPEPGGRFRISYVGDDPKSFNGSAKAFTAEYRKPDPKSSVFGTGDGQQQERQQAADPWQAGQGSASGLSAATLEKVRNLKAMGLDAATIVGALKGEGVTTRDVEEA